MPSRSTCRKLSNLIDKALPKARTKPLDTSKLATNIEAADPQGSRPSIRAPPLRCAQAIRAQVAPCWNPPIGGADVRKMTVVIRADYGQDGRLIGLPRLVSADRGDGRQCRLRSRLCRNGAACHAALLAAEAAGQAL